MFEWRAANAGLERKRCEDAELHSETAPRAQRVGGRGRLGGARGGRLRHGERELQQARAGDEPLAAIFRSMALRVDRWLRQACQRQRGPARRGLAQDDLERAGAGLAAEWSAKDVGTETLGPRVQRRVRGRRAEVSCPGRHP